MQTLSVEQRTFFESAVSRYQADLRADTVVQEYLKERGIGPQVAGTFRLGAVSSPLTGHESYRGRLCIPYLTPSGPVGFNFRCPLEHDCVKLLHQICGKRHICGEIEEHRKYLKPSGSESHLFNVAALKADSPYIVVSEGEIDTITWDMCGVPAVGLAGVNAWEKHFKYCLDDFDVVYVAADPDKAGRGMASLLAKEVNARPIHYPEGMDANELYTRRGADAVRGLIPG